MPCVLHRGGCTQLAVQQLVTSVLGIRLALELSMLSNGCWSAEACWLAPERALTPLKHEGPPRCLLCRSLHLLVEQAGRRSGGVVGYVYDEGPTHT